MRAPRRGYPHLYHATMEGSLSPVSGKRKDVDENLLDDGAGSMKKLKRTLTQEHDLKVIGEPRQKLVFRRQRTLRLL